MDWPQGSNILGRQDAGNLTKSDNALRRRHGEVITCTIRRAINYNIKQIREENASNGIGPNAAIKQVDGTKHTYASDLSGMDCLAYDLNTLESNLLSEQLWACERIQFARQLGVHNYNATNCYEGVINRPIPSPGHLQFYAAGPPCQGLSSAGLGQAWEDPRTRLYMQAIFAIETAKPFAFAIEHADNLQNVENGKLASIIVTRLRANDYHVHATIINTKHYALIQNRARYWIVGIRRDVIQLTFEWPKAIGSMALHELLIPKANDPGHTDIRPISGLAAKYVDKAAIGK